MLNKERIPRRDNQDLCTGEWLWIGFKILVVGLT